jgi:hypothetical protein
VYKDIAAATMFACIAFSPGTHSVPEVEDCTSRVDCGHFECRRT